MHTMSPTRCLSASWRAVLLGATAIAATGCATRHREVLAPPAAVAATIMWRLEPNDLLKVRVYREPELSGEATVGANGSAYFLGVGRVAVAQLTLDSLEVLLNARYGTLLRNPAVQVTMEREITVYGQIRVPGVYAVEPATTMLGLIAKAGGQSGASAPDIVLEASDGRRLTLPREARLGTIDIHRSDAVLLSEQGFFLRNSTAMSATSLMVSMLSTLVGLILVVSR